MSMEREEPFPVDSGVQVTWESTEKCSSCPSCSRFEIGKQKQFLLPLPILLLRFISLEGNHAESKQGFSVDVVRYFFFKKMVTRE